jgi:hypothetical protein
MKRHSEDRMAFGTLSESLLFTNFENCPSSKKGSLKRLILGWLVDVTGIEPVTPVNRAGAHLWQSVGAIDYNHGVTVGV